MSAENSETCPSCGESIPAEAPDGLCPRCLLSGIVDQPTPPPSDISIEEVQESFPDFEILELIGIGGIGRVYRVRDSQVDRIVALKILSPDRVEDPEWIERFTREAKALARLNHPHIVQVHSFGTDPQPHLVMEFVDGVNLRQTMEAGGLSAREALVIVPKLCDALHYAHEHGVLHRDIKPENILVDTEGRVKLVDFGLAKLHDEESLPFTLTQSGAKLGTIAYMAPEQVEHPSDVDHRADIYSLGVVFYEMLTGELPLGRFPSPSEANGTDERLDGVVMRTLEKKKEKRFPDAGTMGSEIGRASTSTPVPSSAKSGIPLAVKILGVVFAIPLLAMISYGVIGMLSAQKTIEDGRQLADRMSAEAETNRARADAQLASEKKKAAEREEKQAIYTRAREWTAEVARTDDAEAKAKALEEIREAIQSEDSTDVLAGLSVLPYSTQIDFDRAPFQDPIRKHLQNEDWEIRSNAISSLFATDYEPSDVEAVIDMIGEPVPNQHLGTLASALATDNKSDFTKKHAEQMLALLQQGYEVAQSGRDSQTGFDSRYLLGVLWGAKVTPEIETVVIEWSELDADENGQINTNSRGYNAFYHALSVLANKSTASVERVLLLAQNADTTNIGGRCLWGLKGTVPDKEDQKLVAKSVIELLGQRNGDYQWRRGLELLGGYATPENIPALTELASREAMSEDRRKKLQNLIERLSAKPQPDEVRRQAAQHQKAHELAMQWITEVSLTDEPETKARAIQEILAAMKSDDPELNFVAGRAYQQLRNVSMDRSLFRNPLRKLIADENLRWEIRGEALANYFLVDYDPFDKDPILEFVDSIPVEHLGSAATTISRDNGQDFIAKHGTTMLRLLQRGFESTQGRGPRPNESLFKALDGARVNPEIESLIVEWTRLDTSNDRPMTINSPGKFAFSMALCGISNKSSTSVERLLELAANPNVVDIGARSLWGMKGTVPNISDQKLAASGTIKILEQRNNDYMWEQGLALLHGYAAREHLEDLKGFLDRRDIPLDRKKRLREIIARIES